MAISLRSPYPFLPPARAVAASTAAVTAAMLAAGLAGCGSADDDEGGGVDGTITVTSPTIEEGGEIPAMHACEPGDGESPALAFDNIPAEATSLALVMRDETIRFTHWVVVDIPATTTEVAAGAPPDGGMVKLGYSAVCPPSDQTHTYVWTLYALAGATPDDPNPSAVALALAGEAIAEGRLRATYTGQ